MGDEAFAEVKYMTTTRLGEKGQLTIPKEFRESLNLEPGEPLAVMRVGPGLMVYVEQLRFREVCLRLAEFLEGSDSIDSNLLGGVAAVIANQERIIANQQKILAKQETILKG